MKIIDKLKLARQINSGISSEHEKARIGTLRGGSGGIATLEGETAGRCPRLSYLRSIGLEVQDEMPEEKLIVFDRGKDQEYSVLNDIERTLSNDTCLLKEEQIPTEWFTKNGMKVTGRPDGVICKIVPLNKRLLGVGYSNTLVLGLEIKSIGSFWVSRDVLLAGKPKLDHLIQAAHYSWQLGKQVGLSDQEGLPYKLIYRQNSQLIIPKYPTKGGGLPIPGFISQFLPKNKDDTTHKLHGLIKFDKSGVPGEIKPYTLVYDIKIVDGTLKFKPESDEEYIETVVTVEGIRQYYELVSKLKESGAEAPVAPDSIDYSGEKAGFNVCDYCPLGDLCCGKKEGKKLTWKEWLGRTRQLVEERNK